MSLSEQELRALREIEQTLLAEDPNFGSPASVGDHFSERTGTLTLRGVALVVVGLLMMVGGVALAQQSLWFVGLSVAGFLVMFLAGVWMLRANAGAGGATAVKIPTGKSNGSAKAKRVSKLEENFRRRFEDQ